MRFGAGIYICQMACLINHFFVASSETFAAWANVFIAAIPFQYPCGLLYTFESFAPIVYIYNFVFNIIGIEKQRIQEQERWRQRKLAHLPFAARWAGKSQKTLALEVP